MRVDHLEMVHTRKGEQGCPGTRRRVPLAAAGPQRRALARPPPQRLPTRPRRVPDTTRNLLHLGGTITYTPTGIHIELDPPNTPRLTRALTLLLQEINTAPPHLPSDYRPITYTITK